MILSVAAATLVSPGGTIRLGPLVLLFDRIMSLILPMLVQSQIPIFLARDLSISVL